MACDHALFAVPVTYEASCGDVCAIISGGPTQGTGRGRASSSALRSICALTILISSTGGPTSASQIPEPASALRAQRITSAGKQAVRWAIWRFGIWTQSTQLSCPDYWRFITALARSTVFRQLGLLAKLKSTSEKSCVSDACSSQGTILAEKPGGGHWHSDFADESVKFFSVYSYLIIYRP
jgi:hypothetical protein